MSHQTTRKGIVRQSIYFMKMLALILIAALGLITAHADIDTYQSKLLAMSSENAGDLIGTNPEGYPNIEDSKTELYLRTDAISGGYTVQADIDTYVSIAIAEAKKARTALQNNTPNTHIWSKPEVSPGPLVATSPAPIVVTTTKIPSTTVVYAITGNRWSGDALIVSGTLKNTNALPVLIENISATGFDKNQNTVIAGSDYTIVHNDLAPGETVNFKMALKDATRQIKFVKVSPDVAGQ
jgi:hypothetical protein